MVINIIGQPGSGKTTLARELKKHIANSVVLDGDMIRLASQNTKYDKEGRISNLKLAYNLALDFEKQGLVPIIAMVSPYNHLRTWLYLNSNQCIQVRLSCTIERGRELFFAKDWEEPENTELWSHFNTAITPVELIRDSIIKLV